MKGLLTMWAPRALAVVVVTAVVAATLGCPARRDGLARDALERGYAGADATESSPTIGALLARRVPAPPTQPATIHGSDLQRAFALGDTAAVAAGSADDANLLRCLMADAQRDYATIAESCMAFLEDKAGDLRAAIVVAILSRHISSLDLEVSSAMAQRLSVLPCAAKRGAGSCAPLAVAVNAFMLALDDAGGSAADTHVAIADAVVEGPWIDAESHFRAGPSSSRTPIAAGPKAKAPMVPHPSLDKRHITLFKHRLRPALGAPNGFYRLTFRGVAGADGNALVSLSSTSAFELSVDGEVVLVRRSGDPSANIEGVSLWLAAGAHVVEVLVADSGSGVSLSVINDDGAPALRAMADGAWSKPAAHRRRDGAPLTPLLLPPTLDGADAASLSNVLLRQSAGRLGFYTSDAETQSLTRDLAAAFGWSPVAATAVALAVEGDSLPAPTLLALSAPYWRVVEASWPDSPLPKLTRARAAVDDQPEMALSAYRRLTQSAPLYPIGLRELVGQLCDRDLSAEAVEVAERLLALRRGREELSAAIRAYSAAGARSTAAILVDERTRRFEGRSAQLRVALERGEDPAALVKSAVAEAGADPRALLELTGAVLDVAELVAPDVADGIIDAALAVTPDADGLALRRLQARRVRSELATSLSQRVSLDAIALAIDGGMVPPWQGLADAGDDAVAARRAGPTPFPDASAVFLRFVKERHFAEDGTSLMMRHWLVEVRAKEAIDAIGELRQGEGELLIRLRVHGVDGSTREPEHHAGVRDISLTGLAPGDIVEWLSVAPDDAAVHGAFWEVESFARAWPTVHQSSLSSWPASFEERRAVVAIASEGAPTPQRQRVNDRVELRYSVDNVDGAREEVHSAPAVEDIPQAGIAIDTPDDVVVTLRRQQRRGIRVTDPWLTDVATEVAGRGSDLEKLGRLFQFVATHITEAPSPSAAPSTLATGRGQRLALLAALAEGAGLNVEYWALHPRLQPKLTLPSTSAFGTIVVAVDVDDRRAIVASFDDGLLLDRLPRALEGAQAFDIDSGTDRILPKTAFDPSVIEIQVDLTLAPSDDPASSMGLKGLGVIRLPAPIAEPLRGALRGANNEQIQRFVEGVFASSFPGVAATKVSIPGLKSFGGPLAFVADLQIPVESSGQIRFEHIFADGAAAAMRAAAPLSSYVRTTQRKRTLVVAPHAEKLEVVLRLPETASVIEVPPPADLVAGPFRLQQRTAVGDGMLRFERSISAELARVAPAEWPPLRAALAPLITTSDSGLSVVVASPASPAPL